MQSLKKILNNLVLPHFLRWLQFVKIFYSTAFSAVKYKAVNSDVRYSNLRSLWHFCRYSRAEARPMGHALLNQWLLDLLLDGFVPATPVRKLLAKIKKTPENETVFIEDFCEKNGLSYKVFLALQAYQRTHNNKIQGYLNEIDPNKHAIETLVLHYLLATKIGIHEGAEASVIASLNYLKTDTKLSLRAYVALSELSESIGMKYHKGRTVSDHIVSHMERTKYQANRSLRQDLWAIGLPIFDDNTELSQALIENLPATLRVTFLSSPPIGGEVTGWTQLLNAMSANRLGLGAYKVSIEAGEVKAVKDVASLEVISVRVMPQTYWALETINFEFSQHLKTLKKILMTLSREYKYFDPIAAGQIYDVSSLDVSHNRLISYHSYGVIKDTKVLHFKESALPKYYSLDKCGFSGWACPNLSESLADTSMEGFFEALQQDILNRKTSKYDQPISIESQFEAGFIFVPLQMPYDSVAQHARLDIFDVIRSLASDSAETRQIVIKRHPKDNSEVTEKKLKALMEVHPDIIQSQENIHDLISDCSLVITVNSGVGVEALLHYKPVITLGVSDYENVAYPLSQLADLNQVVETAKSESVTEVFKKNIRKYIYSFYAQNCLCTDKDETVQLVSGFM